MSARRVLVDANHGRGIRERALGSASSGNGILRDVREALPRRNNAPTSFQQHSS
jgi:hypothetical protein